MRVKKGAYLKTWHTITCLLYSFAVFSIILHSSSLKEMGFSDHIILPNHSQNGIRGDYSLFNDYISSINSLKEKYKDKILLHVGFEAEYFKEYESYYRSLLEEGKIEYLILGQHCHINKETNQLQFYDYHNLDLIALENYKTDLINGMKCGLYS